MGKQVQYLHQIINFYYIVLQFQTVLKKKKTSFEIFQTKIQCTQKRLKYSTFLI
jgi:hypothetical protein